MLNAIFSKSVVVCLLAVLFFAGCTLREEGHPSGTLLKARKDYNQGIAYDQAWQMRLAELYYGKAYRAMRENPSEDWWLYGEAAFRYSHMLSNRGDMDGAVAVLSDILPVAQESADFPAAQLSTLLSKMAYCQRELQQYDAAKQTYAEAYEARIKAVGGEGKGIFDLVVMCDCIYLSLFEMGEYDEAQQWLNRADAEFAVYGQHGDSVIINEYSALQPLYRVRLLQATGHRAEAAAMYEAIPRSLLLTPMGCTKAAEYMMAAGRYGEAADLYASIDTTFGSFSPSHITFDVISEYITPRYLALRQAGRTSEALRMADTMTSAIDSALIWQKTSDAAELAVIYQTHEKELALAKSNAKTAIYRLVTLAVLLLLLLVGYILWRVRRDNELLTEKNRSLYEQIQQREKAEEINDEFRKSKFEVQKTELSQNRQLYERLCKLMEDPEVYTDPNANHETLARLLGTNRTYLAEALHECADTTPADFINRYRVRHAARLLATTDDPVGLVAEECGITNRSTFARLFREHYSMTPSEYRKAAR